MKDIKEEYRKIEASERLKSGGWDALHAQMGQKRKGLFVSMWINRAYFAIVLSLAFFTGMFSVLKIADAAMPGTNFYPIKRLAEDVVEKATGSNEVAIEHRKEEIVILVEEKEENDEVLKEVVREYTENVREEKEKTEGPQKEERKRKLKKRLEEHHEEFDEVQREHPSSEEDLEEVLRATEKDDDDDDHEEGHGDED